MHVHGGGEALKDNVGGTSTVHGCGKVLQRDRRCGGSTLCRARARPPPAQHPQLELGMRAWEVQRREDTLAALLAVRYTIIHLTPFPWDPPENEVACVQTGQIKIM